MIILLLLFLPVFASSVKPSSLHKLNYYQLLGFSDDSSFISLSEIKKAYFNLALKFHPDKDIKRDSQPFYRITDAHKVLSDPIKRKRYDILLEQGEIDYIERDWNSFDIIHNINQKSVFTEKIDKEFFYPDSNSNVADDENDLIIIIIFFFTSIWFFIAGYYLCFRKNRDRTRNFSNIKDDILEAKLIQAFVEEEHSYENNEEVSELNERMDNVSNQSDSDSAQITPNGFLSTEDVLDSTSVKTATRFAQFSCQVCKKQYKSQNQLLNHIQSISHRKRCK